MLKFCDRDLLKNASLFYCLVSGFISEQYNVPAHMAQLAQDWIATNCSEFFGKDE